MNPSARPHAHRSIARGPGAAFTAIVLAALFGLGACSPPSPAVPDTSAALDCPETPRPTIVRYRSQSTASRAAGSADSSAGVSTGSSARTTAHSVHLMNVSAPTPPPRGCDAALPLASLVTLSYRVARP